MPYTVQDLINESLKLDLAKLARRVGIITTIAAPLVAGYLYLDAHPTMPPPSPEVAAKVLLGVVLVAVVFPLVRVLRNRNRR